MSKWGRELPASDFQIWRMHKSRLWIFTLATVGGWSGCGVWLMLQGELALGVLGLVAIAIGFIWAWIQVWLPKAVLTSSDLWVMNRIRTHRIELDEVAGAVDRAMYVTFVLNDDTRIEVTSIVGWHKAQTWNRTLATHAVAFADAVFAAKELKLRSAKN